MADNALTQGMPSGQGENSSSAPGVLDFAKQQDAEHQAQRAQIAAAEAAKVAAFNAAKRKPSANKQSSTLDPGDFPGGFTVHAAPTKAVRKVGGRKG